MQNTQITLPEMVSIISSQGDYELGLSLVSRNGEFVRNYNYLKVKKYLQNNGFRLPTLFEIFHGMKENSDIDESTIYINEYVDDILIPIESAGRGLYRVKRIIHSEVEEERGKLIRVAGKEKIICIPEKHGFIAGIDEETMFPTEVSEKPQEKYHNAYWRFYPESEIAVQRGSRIRKNRHFNIDAINEPTFSDWYTTGFRPARTVSL